MIHDRNQEQQLPINKHNVVYTYVHATCMIMHSDHGTTDLWQEGLSDHIIDHQILYLVIKGSKTVPHVHAVYTVDHASVMEFIDSVMIKPVNSPLVLLLLLLLGDV